MFPLSKNQLFDLHLILLNCISENRLFRIMKLLGHKTGRKWHNIERHMVEGADWLGAPPWVPTMPWSGQAGSRNWAPLQPSAEWAPSCRGKLIHATGPRNEGYTAFTLASPLSQSLTLKALSAAKKPGLRVKGITEPGPRRGRRGRLPTVAGREDQQPAGPGWPGPNLGERNFFFFFTF